MSNDLLGLDSDFDLDPALNSTPEFPLPKNAHEYTERFKALDGSPEHTAFAHEFYLLCLLRFGSPAYDSLKPNNEWSWSDKYYEEFVDFRDEVLPDYFANPRIPVIEAIQFVRWYDGLLNDSSPNKPLSER